VKEQDCSAFLAASTAEATVGRRKGMRQSLRESNPRVTVTDEARRHSEMRKLTVARQGRKGSNFITIHVHEAMLSVVGDEETLQANENGTRLTEIVYKGNKKLVRSEGTDNIILRQQETGRKAIAVDVCQLGLGERANADMEGTRTNTCVRI
jgi:hypothetical protein